ncbi:MAG TPA: penicillin-binding transpeptidase domain-containing protein [Terriglobia bacterium]|nr:penicillin-binding transpeptidase domain-containing protein [Terriglobia bacterium]
MENSSKRFAILALAMVWLLGMEIAAAAPRGSSGNPDISPAPPVKNSPPAKSSARKTTATRRRTRRSRQVRDPWGLSSYGEPAAEDNPAGEDPVIRQAALDALGNWNGSIVVVDPNSGRILSMVNQKLALSSGFTPCSTIKPVVALAALREGIISPTTKLYVGNRERMNVTEALAHSNNVFFHKLGEMLGFQRITEYAQEFGLGEKAGVDIPGESAGRYPSAPPKEGGVGFLAYCGTNIEVTALQMAAIISTIANGGTLYALQYPRTAEEIAAFQPVVRRRLDNLANYIPQIHDGLAGSVLYGTGRSAYDPDLAIYGKTGTCSENGARLGWFASYAGELHPQYVAVVLLRGGRMMWGPHAAEIAGHFYRGLMQKEHSTQASREVSSSTASGR